MMRNALTILGIAILSSLALATINLSQQQQQSTGAAPVAAGAQTQAPSAKLMPVEAQRALVDQHCVGCHNDDTPSGGLDLTAVDFARVDRHAEVAEKVVKKLRMGLMPPSTAPSRPDPETVKAFVTALETQLDRAAALRPNPGSRTFQRLTRDEYARSIRDLLGIEVDVAQFLPPDTVSDGLDNIADNQAFSPALMEGYIRAATKIAREALGDPKAEPTSAIYKLSRMGSQLTHVDGAPYGTRGGISVVYNFPADGEYSFRGLLHGTDVGGLFGNVANEQLEVSIDKQRVGLMSIPLTLSEASPNGLNLTTGRVFVKAGPHRVSAAFLQKHSILVQEVIAQHNNTLADVTIGRSRELTVYPHLREFEISGPYNATGVSDTPTRRRVFTCRPLSLEDELPCAAKIISDLARQAYRRPVTAEDMEGLMTFYERARKEGGDFESGIRSSLEVILASLYFVARVEQRPATVRPGQSYRISDLDLASRLSYFLWNTAPDDVLINVASQGRLRDPLVLEKQVRRMLADPRSESLATKFAGQWLHLPDLMNIHPEAYYYPQYDQALALSMKREVELFFDSVVREDRNVLDLLAANYTIINERVAKHYGIRNVSGPYFRRVDLADDYRRGLLGKGAILVLTSVADRTSPVLRGKWVMAVLLGTPPPPPPPLVPKLEETAAVAEGKTLTVRERMEMHRSNPACNSCHRMIDPVGLALENFDVTGQWRIWDKTYAISSAGVRVHTAGIPIDAASQMYDGTPLNGPASLREAILQHSDMFIQNLTEKLLAYAIGRRVHYYDMPLIRSIERNAAKNNNRFSSLVLGIIKSPAFQMMKAEPVTTNAAANKN